MNALHVSRSADLPPVGEVAELLELWAWALPLALLGSWTCFGALPGVNWTLWTGASAAGFLVVSRHADRSPANGYPRAALALACLLSVAAAVTADPRADALIFLSVAGLSAFAVLATATLSGDVGPAALVRAPLVLCRLVLTEAAARMTETLATLRMRAAIPVLRASTMAAALAGTLFLLLSAADPTLASWRDIAWQTVLSRMFLARDVFFVVLATLLVGGFGLAARCSKPVVAAHNSGGQPAPSPPAAGLLFSALERLIVLAAALALFVVFFAAELSNQLAASAVHLTDGETFAEATHRGFGEMIIAAALCAIVIIALDRRALRNGMESGVRLLSWSVIAASLVVVASAYQRVRYYEAAYGYTELRLYVQVCCAVISLALLSLAWELRSTIDIPRLIRHLALVVIASVAGLSYWNTAAWIVDANMARYRSAGKLDVSYLERLGRSSPDAIPALVDVLPLLAPSDAKRVRDSLKRVSLDRSIVLPPTEAGGLSWYEWSLRRAAAQAALRKAVLLDDAATR